MPDPVHEVEQVTVQHLTPGLSCRYFGFITKHPADQRFACHVFVSENSTKALAEAVGCVYLRTCRHLSLCLTSSAFQLIIQFYMFFSPFSSRLLQESVPAVL